MRRRQSGPEGDHFDLLPFISILMCTLGCLLFTTLSVAALSLGPGTGEGWIPVSDEDGPAKTPILIEWADHTSVIHQGGRRTTSRWTDAAWDLMAKGRIPDLTDPDQRPPDEMVAFLDDLETKSSTHYALFAVRPSGFNTFQPFAAVLRNRSIDVGYEPIAEGRPVRLLRKEARR